MTNRLITSIKRRTPARAKRAVRRVSTVVRRPVTPSGGDGATRIAELEAELRETRTQVRRAELRTDFVRQASSTEVAALQAEVAALQAELEEARTQARPAEPTSAADRDGDHPPSFRYLLGEQRRISHAISDELQIIEPVWAVNPKLAGREWADGLGVRVPELLAGPVNIVDLDLDALPDHFVIKPVAGHSSRGVFLLHRVGPDSYRSLLDRRELFSREQLLERYARWRDNGSIPDLVIVERLLFDGPPDDPAPPIDFRFFCFYGEVGFVMARHGHGTRAGSRVRFRFFDDEWSDLGVVRLDIKNDPTIAVPRQAEAMVDAARRLSAAIPRPMVRIDLFDADDAAYFGEVTPFPGGNFAMAPEHDRRFGEQWERAAARLERDAIEAGIRALRA